MGCGNLLAIQNNYKKDWLFHLNLTTLSNQIQFYLSFIQNQRITEFYNKNNQSGLYQIVYIFLIQYKGKLWKFNKILADFRVLANKIKELGIENNSAYELKDEPKIFVAENRIINDEYYIFHEYLKKYLMMISYDKRLQNLFEQFIEIQKIFQVEDMEGKKCKISFDINKFNVNNQSYQISNNNLNLNYTYQIQNHQVIFKLQIASLKTLLFKFTNILQFLKIYHSFTLFTQIIPPANNNQIHFFIDSHHYFQNLQQKLLSAKQTIYITSYILSPELYLIRPVSKSNPFNYLNTLKAILEKKSQQGIQIFIILWKSPIILPYNSKNVYQTFNLKATNIKIITHPHSIPLFLFTHHQKLILIDQKIAFIGGIDLCYGRYDDQEHKMFDYISNQGEYQMYPQNDYTNPVKHSIKEGIMNRLLKKQQNRLPWHDICIQIQGQIIYELSKQFIQYFSANICDKCFLKNKQCDADQNLAKLQGREIMEYTLKNLRINTIKYIQNQLLQQNKKQQKKLFFFKQKQLKNVGSFTCQLIKSASFWSHKNHLIDKSYQNAYITLIQNSKYYVYIQNQYFISSNGTQGIINKISQAIIQRIIKAHIKNQKFKVIILLPLHLQLNMIDFIQAQVQFKSFDIMINQQIFFWQLQTICKGQGSIFNSLKRQGINPHQYIKVLSLRTHCINPYNNQPETQIIYIHSKFMIIDDEYCIIGSGNLNDRSMNGDRDSDLGILMKDEKKIEKLLNNKIVKVSKNIYQFRKNIFKQHFEFKQDQLDILLEQNWQLLISRAQLNTAIYESIFNCIPSNNIKNINLFKQWSQKPKNLQLYEKRKSQIKGNVVIYPLDFLVEDIQKLRTRLLEILMFQMII